jgi:hypothetical protein
MYEADIWIEDAKMSLDGLMSQCKEWWHDPSLEKWCMAVRSEAANAIAALEELQSVISKQPR